MTQEGEKHPTWFKMKLERRELIRELSPETAVNILLACWEYLETGQKPNGLSPLEAIAFAAFTPDLEESWEKYRKRNEALKRANEQRLKLPSDTIRKHTPPYANHMEAYAGEEETETEKEKKRKEIYPPKSPQGGQSESLGVETAPGTGTPADHSATSGSFERFWKVYPKKVGKGAARKAWEKIRPTESLTEKIIQAVETAKGSSQWQRDHGQYIPHPATWLNQERWEDELSPAEAAPAKFEYSYGGLEDSL